jgi:hypothetical protein
VPSHGPSVIVSEPSASRDCKVFFYANVLPPHRKPGLYSRHRSRPMSRQPTASILRGYSLLSWTTLSSTTSCATIGVSQRLENGRRATSSVQALTMDVTNVIEHYENFIVTANVVGKFDMTGLPDPLVYAFYFIPHGDRIVQLIILRNRYDI